MAATVFRASLARRPDKNGTASNWWLGICRRWTTEAVGHLQEPFFGRHIQHDHGRR